MGFVRGREYTRARIAEELGLTEQKHAVFVDAGRAVAIVVTAVGLNPFNRKSYVNTLTETEFRMQGEREVRGNLSEEAGPIHLFLLHRGGGGYCYEGLVRYRASTDYAGELVREFDRLP